MTLCGFLGSCTWVSVFLFRFGKFSAIISSNTFSIPFSLSSPSGSPIMCRLARFILSHRSCLSLLFFGLSFCLLFWLGDVHYSVFLFIILHYLVNYSLLLDQFLSWQLSYLMLIVSSLRFLVHGYSDLPIIMFINSFSILGTSLVAQTVKASAYNAGDPGSIPGLGRSPGEGNGTPLQYSCLENPTDGGAW